MARDGSGNYSLPEAPFVFDTVISETAVNSNFSDIASALTQSRSKDGQTTPTANQNYGGYRHTNIATSAGSSSRSEYVASAVAQDGGLWDAGATAGTSTAYTATLTPAITAYADKQCFRVKFNAACGANPTINFNSVGAKKIYKNVAGTETQLAANDVPEDFVGTLRYDTALDAAAGGFWLINLPDASNVPFTNTDSGLSATNVQAAIDEIVAERRVWKSGAAVTAPADTVENTLATISVPANALGANGFIRFSFSLGVTNNANAKNIRLRYSGAAGTQLMNANAANVSAFMFQGTLSNSNATNAQRTSVHGGNVSGWSLQAQLAQSAIDTTAATTIVITAQKASAGDTVTLIDYLFELIADGS